MRRMIYTMVFVAIARGITYCMFNSIGVSYGQSLISNLSRVFLNYRYYATFCYLSWDVHAVTISEISHRVSSLFGKVAKRNYLVA
ncbi:hypothetical protein F4811DRAFT_510002 [Daldinia bambusicola]|nr:hypothetical protein F4811DRAFT_510002 [Daldinia bambusicola]